MAEVSTFSAFEKRLEQPQEPIVTPTPEPIAAPTPSAVIVPEPIQPTPVITPEPVVQPEPNVSTFNISSPDEPAIIPEPTPTQPVFNLDEELKKVDQKELLKKLGLSEFAIEIDQHLKGGGNPIDYLNAKSIDYSKVSDDVLLKAELKREYPTLSPSQIETMFKRKYEVPLDASPEDKEFYEATLIADAYKVRQGKISEQQKFKLPDAITPVKDEAYDKWKESNKTREQRVELLNNYYSDHEATKKLNESKRVAIDLGKDVAPFNFVIDRPEMITKAFTDGGETWQKLTHTPQGEPDVAKQQLIALFTYNPAKFIQDIFKYGQSHGLKEVVEEGQNAQRPQAIVTQMPADSKQTVTVGKYGGGGRQ